MRASFSMPTDSGARGQVECHFVGKLSFATATWLVGDAGTTFLYVDFPEGRERWVRETVLGADPRVILREVDLTP